LAHTLAIINLKCPFTFEGDGIGLVPYGKLRRKETYSYSMPLGIP
jgi:hypothetical protein